MKLRHSILTSTLVVALVGVGCADRTPVLVQQEPEVRTIVTHVQEPEVRTIVTNAGYGEPVVVVRDGDLWRVESVDNDSHAEVTLFVNEEGEVLGASDVARKRIAAKSTTTTTTTTTTEPERLTQPASVITVIRGAGFHNVHDVEFSERQSVWIAEADDITGDDFELYIDPETGHIVRIEED
jgi:hypothetical protein